MVQRKLSCTNLCLVHNLYEFVVLKSGSLRNVYKTCQLPQWMWTCSSLSDQFIIQRVQHSGRLICGTDINNDLVCRQQSIQWCFRAEAQWKYITSNDSYRKYSTNYTHRNWERISTIVQYRPSQELVTFVIIANFIIVNISHISTIGINIIWCAIVARIETQDRLNRMGEYIINDHWNGRVPLMGKKKGC